MAPVEDTSIVRRAQEITFKAEIPTATLCPEFIHWLVEWKNGATWEPLYEFQSISSRTNEFTENGKLFTRFGATGLKPGREHRIAVAYKCTAPPEYPSSTCFSDFAYDGTGQEPPGFVPSAFRGGNSLPLIPSEFRPGGVSYQEIEDSFTRPATLSKRNTSPPYTLQGDGLGPDAVWLDSNPYGGTGNGARVSNAGGSYYAVFPQGATAQYAPEFSNSHSFVEASFGRESLNSGANVVNFELHGRQFMDGSTLRSYWVKFLKGRLGAPADQAHILIGSPTCLGVTGDPPVQEPTPSGWSECKGAGGSLTWVEMKRFAIPKTDPGLPSEDPNYKCWGLPTLTAGTDQRMWLQLRIQDDPLQGDNPHVYAIAAWDPNSPTTDCGTTGDITSCPRVCRVDVIDPTVTIGDVMETQKGDLMCVAHDANYRSWVIRGGSKP